MSFQREALTQYSLVSKTEKTTIIDRIVSATRAHRKSVIRALNASVEERLNLAAECAPLLGRLRTVTHGVTGAAPLLDAVEEKLLRVFPDTVFERPAPPPPRRPLHPHEQRAQMKAQKRALGNNHGNSRGDRGNAVGNNVTARGHAHGNSSIRADRSDFIEPAAETPRKPAISGNEKNSLARAREGNSGPMAPVKNERMDPYTDGGATAPRSPRATARVFSDERARAIPPHVAVPLLQEAGEILGLRYWLTDSSEMGKQALRLAALRIAEGATPADLLKACRIVVQRWENGERWAGLKQFSYIWGSGLGSILVAGAERPRAMAPSAPVFRKGEELDRWMKGMQEQPTADEHPSILLGPNWRTLLADAGYKDMVEEYEDGART